MMRVSIGVRASHAGAPEDAQPTVNSARGL